MEYKTVQLSSGKADAPKVMTPIGYPHIAVVTGDVTGPQLMGAMPELSVYFANNNIKTCVYNMSGVENKASMTNVLYNAQKSANPDMKIHFTGFTPEEIEHVENNDMKSIIKRSIDDAVLF